MTIPMELPRAFLDEIASGKLIRYGAVLKDASTGKIVGHLKETGAMESLVSEIFTSPMKLARLSNPLGLATDAIGHGVNAYQLRSLNRSVEEVKSLIEGVQLATNVAAIGSLVGLGVSVAGFAATLGKLKKIDSKIDGMANDIAVLKQLLTKLSIKWEAMSEAQFLTACDAVSKAENADTKEGRERHASQAAIRFTELRHYYAQLLRQTAIWTDPEIDLECAYELMARYTIACTGMLQAEFLLGDLGSYGVALRGVTEEYPTLATFSARKVYLSRCDAAHPLDVETDHAALAQTLTTISQTAQENAARLEGGISELDYLLSHGISSNQYLKDLREHPSDIVLIRHES